MNLTVSEETVVELNAYLSGRKKIDEAICKKFEERYNTLDLLEKRIEDDGVPLDNHSLWDDAIKWRNAVAELNKIDYYDSNLWHTQ